MALNYLGYFYADKNIHLDEADKMLTHAVSIDPTNPAYLDSMGWLRYRQGQYDKAAEFLTEAARRTRDALIYEHLADVRAAQNDDVAAVIAYNDAVLTDPSAKAPKAKMKKILKRMPPARKAEVFARLAHGRFLAIRSVDSLINVKIARGHSFSTTARFTYKADEILRAEIPGPLSGPMMLLEKKFGQKAEYGAVHPQFQDAGPAVTRCFDRIDEVLSARFFKNLDSGRLTGTAAVKGGRIVGDAGPATVAFDADGNPVEIRWTAENGGDWLSITPSDTLLPAAFEWHGADGVSLHVQFVKPAVSSVVERDLSVEKPAAHPSKP